MIVIRQLDQEVKEFSVCSSHMKKQMFACIDDGIPICKYCVDSKTHENHSILTLKEIKAKAVEKMLKVQELLEFYQGGASKKSCVFFEQEKYSIKQNIQDNFTMLRDLLTKQEDEALKQIDAIFHHQVKKMRDMETQHAKLIQEIQILQIYLSGLVINKNFFEAFNHKALNQFLIDNIKEETAKFTKQIKESNWTSINKLCDSICFSIKDFQPFDGAKTLVIPDKIDYSSEKLEKSLFEEALEEEQKRDFRKVQRNSPKSEEDEEEKVERGSIDDLEYDYEKDKIIHPHLNSLDEVSEKEVRSSSEHNEERNYSEYSGAESLENIDQLNSQNRDFRIVSNKIKDTPLYVEQLKNSIINGKAHLGFDQIPFHRETMGFLNKVFQETQTASFHLKITMTTKDLLKSEVLTDFCALSLWKNLNLQSLSLDINKRVSFNSPKRSFVQIIKSIRKMKKLKEFSLKVSNTNADDSVLIALAKPPLISVTSIKNLKLDFSNSSISSEGFVKFFDYNQAYFAALDAFDVNFSGNKIKSDSILYLSYVALPKFQKLRSFTLRISGSQLVDSAAQDLFLNMKLHLHSLKQLQLDLEATRISDISIKTFVEETMPRLNKLETFEFHLSNTLVTDKSILLLLVAIKNLAKNLRIFRLDLPRTEVTDQSLHAFVNHALTDFQALESFELRLAYSKVTFNGVGRFLTEIEKSHSFKAHLKWFEITLQKDWIQSLTKRFPVLHHKQPVQK